MANTKSAKKFLVTSRIKRIHNSSNRSMLRTFIKKTNTAILNKDKSKAISLFKIVQKIVDHQVFTGLIHKNKAARYKSNIFKKIKTITT